MYTLKPLAAATAIAVGAASSISAATVTVGTYSSAQYADFTANADVLVQEDFEGLTRGEGSVSSSVGSFTTVGGTGTGGSVVGTGTDVSVINTGAYGRRNTTLGGSQYLDSNDTLGIAWTVSLGGRAFERLAFSLSDAADGGALMSILVNGESLATINRQGNGTINWVVIEFASPIDFATVEIANNRKNDGFAIDDVSIAAVPVPAAGLMLLTALGGAAALRRRKS